jgi:hypothetical protein
MAEACVCNFPFYSIIPSIPCHFFFLETDRTSLDSTVSSRTSPTFFFFFFFFGSFLNKHLQASHLSGSPRAVSEAIFQFFLSLLVSSN